MPALADLLSQVEPEPAAVERAATDAFRALSRTDMRSGVANMIRRLAQLAASGDQPIDARGWQALRRAASLLDDANLPPAAVRQLDGELRAVGLDVDARPRQQAQ